jgi:hypothetical protein
MWAHFIEGLATVATFIGGYVWGYRQGRRDAIW